MCSRNYMWICDISVYVKMGHLVSIRTLSTTYETSVAASRKATNNYTTRNTSSNWDNITFPICTGVDWFSPSGENQRRIWVHPRDNGPFSRDLPKLTRLEINLPKQRHRKCITTLSSDLGIRKPSTTTKAGVWKQTLLPTRSTMWYYSLPNSALPPTREWTDRTSLQQHPSWYASNTSRDLQISMIGSSEQSSAYTYNCTQDVTRQDIHLCICCLIETLPSHWVSQSYDAYVDNWRKGMEQAHEIASERDIH